MGRVNRLLAKGERFVSPPSILPLLYKSRELSERSDALLAKTVRGPRPPKRTHLVLTSALRGFAFERMQVPSDHDYRRERDALVEVLSAYLARYDRA